VTVRETAGLSAEAQPIDVDAGLAQLVQTDSAFDIGTHCCIPLAKGEARVGGERDARFPRSSKRAASSMSTLTPVLLVRFVC
jgi:hypothetical protein